MFVCVYVRVRARMREREGVACMHAWMCVCVCHTTQREKSVEDAKASLLPSDFFTPQLLVQTHSKISNPTVMVAMQQALLPSP